MIDEINGLLVGCVEKIDFNFVCNDYSQHAFNFKMMTNNDKTVLAITYQWADPITKMFNDCEEAFYIENITQEKYEFAKKIMEDVYNSIKEAFNKDSYQQFDLVALVKRVLDEYRVKGK